MVDILGLIAGALLGVVGTVVVQAFLGRLAQDVASINDMIDDLSKIEALATEYWLSKGKSSFDEERITSARLRGALDATAQFEPAAKRLFRSQFSEYARLDGLLFDAATGGPFETTEREPDPERVIEIAKTVHALRALLRSQRRGIYGAH